MAARASRSTATSISSPGPSSKSSASIPSPTRLIECFAHLFRRKGDENITTMFVDIGAGASHVASPRAKPRLRQAHPHRRDLLNKKVADALGVEPKKARELRVIASHYQAQASRLPAGVVGINADANTHPLGKQNAPAAAPPSDE